MAMGKKPAARQPSPMWVTTADLPTNAGHPFFERLNRVLEEAGFDAFVEGLCAAFYAARMGRPSLRPGRYFRLLFIAILKGCPPSGGSRGGWPMGADQPAGRLPPPASRPPRRVRRSPSPRSQARPGSSSALAVAGSGCSGDRRSPARRSGLEAGVARPQRRSVVHAGARQRAAHPERSGPQERPERRGLDRRPVGARADSGQLRAAGPDPRNCAT